MQINDLYPMLNQFYEWNSPSG